MSWITMTIPETKRKTATMARILSAARQNATQAIARAMKKGVIPVLTAQDGRPSPHDLGVVILAGACKMSATLDLSFGWVSVNEARSMGQHRPCFL
jgi:hypothetical protein